MLNNNEGATVEFTQSARRHKVGRARVLQVLADPVVVVRIEELDAHGIRLLVLGDDATGRAIELIVIEEDECLVEIHAMDLRPKFRTLYENGLQHE